MLSEHVMCYDNKQVPPQASDSGDRIMTRPNDAAKHVSNA